jgi:hypothetical protein
MARPHPFLEVILIGKSIAGLTCKLEPSERQKSDFKVFSYADSISACGSFSPKFIIESFNGPPHASQYLPVR